MWWEGIENEPQIRCKTDQKVETFFSCIIQQVSQACNVWYVNKGQSHMITRFDGGGGIQFSKHEPLLGFLQCDASDHTV